MENLAAPNRRAFSRRQILRHAAVAILAVGLLSSGPAAAKSEDEAGAFLLLLTSRAIGQLTNGEIPIEERKARFRTLFRENFDIAAIGRFVLGRYGRGTPQPVLEDFLTTFEDVMVERFAPQFAGYGNTRFTIGTVHQVEDKGQFIVSSAITPPGTENAVQIDWRVREVNGEFKVLDIVGEGVSMALTLRAEYGSVLKSSGGKVDELVALLRDRLGAQAAAAN